MRSLHKDDLWRACWKRMRVTRSSQAGAALPDDGFITLHIVGMLGGSGRLQEMRFVRMLGGSDGCRRCGVLRGVSSVSGDFEARSKLNHRLVPFCSHLEILQAARDLQAARSL
jgi:hypothetical protein